MRPPRFAVCRDWSMDGTVYVLCHGHRWVWMHNRTSSDSLGDMLEKQLRKPIRRPKKR